MATFIFRLIPSPWRDLPPDGISQQQEIWKEENWLEYRVLLFVYVPKYFLVNFNIIVYMLDDGTHRDFQKIKPSIDSCIEKKLSNILLSKTFAFLLEKLQMNTFIDYLCICINVNLFVIPLYF